MAQINRAGLEHNLGPAFDNRTLRRNMAEVPLPAAPSRALRDTLAREEQIELSLRAKVDQFIQHDLTEEEMDRLEIDLFRNYTYGMEIGTEADKKLQINDKSEKERKEAVAPYIIFYLKNESLNNQCMENFGNFNLAKYGQERKTSEIREIQPLTRKAFHVAHTTMNLAEGKFRADGSLENYGVVLRTTNEALKLGFREELPQLVGMAATIRLRASLAYFEMPVPEWTKEELAEQAASRKPDKPANSAKKEPASVSLEKSEVAEETEEAGPSNAGRTPASAPSAPEPVTDDPQNPWQRVVSEVRAKLRKKIEAAESSNDPGKMLEARVGRMCGSHLRAINKRVFDKRGREIGEVDAVRRVIGGKPVFIEVTTAKLGKRKQIRKYIARPEFKKFGETLIFYAPEYDNQSDLAFFASNGVVHVRNDDEFFAVIQAMQRAG